MTLYSAIWKDGPLHYNSKNERNSNKEVVLKCLHDSHNLIESLLINEVKKYLVKKFCYKSLKLYGISQNSDTNDYILIFNWTSGNDKIDNFIQEMQLKPNHSDIVFEWIPYNQLYDIKETGKDSFMTVYSAIWKDGPLYYNYRNKDHYIRNSNIKVALKCLHNSHNPIDSLMNEVKTYSVKMFGYNKFIEVYGISQNPSTNNYILVQNNFINLVTCMSGNEKIDDLIQTIQLKSNNSDIIFEWIPYDQFYEVKENGKNDLMTIFSAICKDGPLHYDYKNDYYTRSSNEKVALKCMHSLQSPIECLINEVKKYSAKIFGYEFIKIYGISQNPDTNDYILVQNNTINLIDWTSGNEKIDDFIKEMQFKTNNPDIVIKWISYSQFDEIKEIGKGGFATIYSAILNDFKVALKCLDNSQNLIDELLNEVKAYKVLLNNKSLRYISVSEIEEAENYRNLHLSTLKGDRKITTHPQAVYTSRLLNPFTECLDCAITD
ncbi:unnamed protein product [Rhizophagus irregularis]|nr:unnamed protein product [Rhizophagus irregularis]